MISVMVASSLSRFWNSSFLRMASLNASWNIWERLNERRHSSIFSWSMSGMLRVIFRVMAVVSGVDTYCSWV
jgi:hypothetical protein